MSPTTQRLLTGNQLEYQSVSFCNQWVQHCNAIVHKTSNATLILNSIRNGTIVSFAGCAVGNDKRDVVQFGGTADKNSIRYRCTLNAGVVTLQCIGMFI